MSVLMKNEICPFVQEPFNDCYCYNLTSRYISSAIYYCANHYTMCEVYKSNMPDHDVMTDKKSDN
ncbi:MAG: hypothetical protein C4526_05460 [Nitrospiraceae bacterium]|nr:MAG: hypothetical protein C4526_05460 [Nitrospiraceae bacterium]